jgi:hypothetical protein
VEFWVGMKVGILASHMLLSQKPNHKEMQVIHFDRDMQVCGIFLNFPNSKYFWYSLNHESLFWMDAFYSKVWAILFFFLFLSFLGEHLSTHYFIIWTLIHFFSIAHIFLFAHEAFGERDIMMK